MNLQATIQCQQPLVSIGIPVYNEEHHLEKTLISVLTQSYQNLQIIISDNASTDSTPQICKKYAFADSRIEYHRYDKRVDQSDNFNRVMKLAKGFYFAWVGGHDLFESDYVAVCLKEMVHDPLISLCYPDISFIDQEGNKLNFVPIRMDLRNINEPTFRFIAATLLLNRGELIHGLMRTEMIKRTVFPGHSLFPDMVLLAELSLKGKLAYVPFPLVFMRVVREPSSFYKRLKQCEKTMFVRQKSFSFRLPYWRLWVDYIKIVLKSPLDIGRKTFLLVYLLFLFIIRFHTNLFQDVLRLFRR